MASTTSLTGSPTWTEVAPGGYALQAPAVTGTITEMSATENATRSGAGSHEAPLLAALKAAGITPRKAFEIDVAHVAAGAGTRSGGDVLSTPEGEPAMLLRVPHLDDDVEQAVLYTDEAGVSRWIFPRGAGAPPAGGDAAAAKAPITRGGGGGTAIEFLLPRDTPRVPPPASTAPGTRGQLTKLGRRLVRVLAWATEDLVGAGALAAAAHWEKTHRPYGLRRFPFDDARPIDWSEMAKGRCLLLIHGTFSTAQAGFALLPADTIAKLSALYGGRMFAFDHPSLHVSPGDNAQRLLEMLPAGTDLEVDIVTHSRGGLVGRELTERYKIYEGLGEVLRVRRAVFVAAPQRGTILADSQHGIKMLDRYTNLFTELPDGPFTIFAEALFMLAKLSYHGAATGLPGLRSMYPPGDYLQLLNGNGNGSGGGGASPLLARYHAVGADFKPSGESALSRFGWAVGDALVDGVFGEANDGVVPTEGAYALTASSGGFPIDADRRVMLGQADGVHHCNYFAHPRVNEKLLEWLGAA